MVMGMNFLKLGGLCHVFYFFERGMGREGSVRVLIGGVVDVFLG